MQLWIIITKYSLWNCKVSCISNSSSTFSAVTFSYQINEINSITIFSTFFLQEKADTHWILTKKWAEFSLEMQPTSTKNAWDLKPAEKPTEKPAEKPADISFDPHTK